MSYFQELFWVCFVLILRSKIDNEHCLSKKFFFFGQHCIAKSCFGIILILCSKNLSSAFQTLVRASFLQKKLATANKFCLFTNSYKYQKKIVNVVFSRVFQGIVLFMFFIPFLCLLDARPVAPVSSDPLVTEIGWEDPCCHLQKVKTWKVLFVYKSFFVNVVFSQFF